MKLNLPIKSLFDHISSLAKNQSNSVALLGSDKEGKIEQKITYRQLKNRIETTAFWLGKIGLKSGDVVAIAMPSSPEFLILSWTCWSIGIVTVPLDTKRDRIDQHKYKLDIAKAKIVVAKNGIFSTETKCKFPNIK